MSHRSARSQIWELDLGRGRVGSLPEPGNFELQDGLSLRRALPAQRHRTEGLQLLVVDSASSAVRTVRLNDGRVTTLVARSLRIR
jgi:hypothetical protein